MRATESSLPRAAESPPAPRSTALAPPPARPTPTPPPPPPRPMNDRATTAADAERPTCARAAARGGVDRTQSSPVIRDERGTGPRAATKSVRRSGIGGQRGDTRGERARFRGGAGCRAMIESGVAVDFAFRRLLLPCEPPGPRFPLDGLSHGPADPHRRGSALR